MPVSCSAVTMAMDSLAPWNTALLLCTDLRWRRATAGIIAEIAGSGLLDGDDLFVLAESFLNEAATWEAPAAWTDGGWIEIVLHESADSDGGGLGEGNPPPGPLRVRREVRPPLRRWAAAELLRQRPERLDDVFARTQALSARDAAGVVEGTIDAFDALGQQRAPARARDRPRVAGRPGAPGCPRAACRVPRSRRRQATGSRGSRCQDPAVGAQAGSEAAAGKGADPVGVGGARAWEKCSRHADSCVRP
jgi:hypothetical protein